jgi:hypothetical protein
MRLRIFIAPACALAFVAGGCGSQAVVPTARITGIVKLCGGLSNKCFTEPARITVLDANHREVARSHPLDGRFSFALAPGRYTVSAKADGYVIGTVSVSAAAGDTTHANITNNDVE